MGGRDGGVLGRVRRHRDRARRPRRAALVLIRPGADEWTVRQVFDDPDGDHDWGIEAVLDVAATDEAGEPVLHITGVGPVEYLVG